MRSPVAFAPGKAGGPALNTVSLPAATVGTPFVACLAVTGGTAPYAWRIQATKLPAGLTLNGGAGLISGTPTMTGTFPFKVKVTDAKHHSASRKLTITVAPG